MSDIDLARIPHEVSRSMLLDFGVWPEQAQPGLDAFPEGDRVVFKDTTGTIVATVPRYRLDAVDVDYLAARITVEADPSEDVTLVLEAIMAGQMVDDPEHDFLMIAWGGGKGYIATYLAPRSWAVPSWPDSDRPDSETAREIVRAWAASLDLPPEAA